MNGIGGDAAFAVLSSQRARVDRLFAPKKPAAQPMKQEAPKANPESAAAKAFLENRISGYKKTSGELQAQITNQSKIVENAQTEVTNATNAANKAQAENKPNLVQAYRTIAAENTTKLQSAQTKLKELQDKKATVDSQISDAQAAIAKLG